MKYDENYDMRRFVLSACLGIETALTDRTTFTKKVRVEFQFGLTSQLVRNG